MLLWVMSDTWCWRMRAYYSGDVVVIVLLYKIPKVIFTCFDKKNRYR
jgi:hypothetical protein